MKRTRSRCVLAAMVLSLLFSSVGFAFADSNVPTPRDNRHYMVYHDKSMYKTASHSFSQNERQIIVTGGAAAAGIIALSMGVTTAGLTWGGLSLILGAAASTDQLEGLRYKNVFTTERKYYSKDRLTGRESYRYTEWVGTCTWTYKANGGRWKQMYSGSIAMTLK